jgi:putative endonuclease
VKDLGEPRASTEPALREHKRTKGAFGSLPCQAVPSPPGCEVPLLSRPIFSGQATRAVLCFLDWLAARTLPPAKTAPHHRTGRRGEEAAYFHLRRLGYTMVARNFRSPRCHGEIDLIGWENDVLCFIEVKTRTTRDVKPGEAAVDRHKRRLVAAVARDYRRRLPPSCQWRFDVVSVYYEQSKASQPQIEVFRNASLSA